MHKQQVQTSISLAVFLAGSIELLSTPLCSQELNFQIQETPAAQRSLAPNLSAHEGHFVFSWIERGKQRKASLHVAQWNGTSFGEPSTIVESKQMFANWADIPAVISAPSGDLYAHWLDRISSETYAYGIRIAHSTDKGETWKALGWLHKDKSATEHGFVSFVNEANSVRAFWLDGREMAEKGGKMMLRTATLKGGVITDARILDEDVCTCCPTSAAQLTAGAMVVYRDRSAKEIRDISYTRLQESEWTEPALVHADNWLMPGCPVNGPSIAVHRNSGDDGDTDQDLIAVARYTVIEGKAQVILNLSKSDALGLGKDLVIDANEPIGRCATVCTKDSICVLWIARKDGGSKTAGATLQLAEISFDGKLLRSQSLTEIDSARSSGMPRAIYSDGYLWVCWTDAKRVRLGKVKLAG